MQTRLNCECVLPHSGNIALGGSPLNSLFGKWRLWSANRMHARHELSLCKCLEGTMWTTADGDSRSRVPSCGRRYADAPTAVPLTVSGGGEFPPSYARQSSVVTDARRTAVYTPFFLSAPTVPARRSMRYNDGVPGVFEFAGKPWIQCRCRRVVGFFNDVLTVHPSRHDRQRRPYGRSSTTRGSATSTCFLAKPCGEADGRNSPG
jgi:hypothetical protein